jgi:hypothetical protein
MIRCLNESGNLRYDHAQYLSDLGIVTLIYNGAHGRNPTIGILRVAIDVSTVSRNICVRGIEFFQQALGRFHVLILKPHVINLKGRRRLTYNVSWNNQYKVRYGNQPDGSTMKLCGLGSISVGIASDCNIAYRAGVFAQGDLKAKAVHHTGYGVRVPDTPARR